MAKKVCLECGDIGNEKDLIYCGKCSNYSIHRYCMEQWPNTKQGSVHWLCGCESDQKPLSKKPKFNPKFDSKPKKQPQVMKSFTGYGNLYAPNTIAQPIIRSVWTGSFRMHYWFDESTFKSMEPLVGFLSNKAHKNVHDKCLGFEPVIKVEVVPKEFVWPMSFDEAGPTDDNIGVYFFPFLHQQAAYECLLYELVRDDLAMRAALKDSEMLIFTSADLPPKCRRFQGSLFLWGVMRPKQTPDIDHEELFDF